MWVVERIDRKRAPNFGGIETWYEVTYVDTVTGKTGICNRSYL
jgi:hypothetical protein